MIRRATLLCGLAALAPAPAAAQTFSSVYTMLDLDRCRTLEVVPEGESVRRRCPGLGAIPLFVNAGDGRFDVDAGVDNGQWESLGGFNEIGPRIEWRPPQRPPVRDHLPAAADRRRSSRPDRR